MMKLKIIQQRIWQVVIQSTDRGWEVYVPNRKNCTKHSVMVRQCDEELVGELKFYPIKRRIHKEHVLKLISKVVLER